MSMSPRYKSFSEAVEHIYKLDGNLPVQVLQKTPKSLVACGMSDAPVLITVAHMKKALLPYEVGGHSIESGVLAALPELLTKPVAVWRAKERSRSLVLLDETDEFGDPLIAVIAVGTRVDRGNRAIGLRCGDSVNYVLSVYGKTRATRELAAAVHDNRLLLLNRIKYESLCARIDIRVDRAA